MCSVVFTAGNMLLLLVLTHLNNLVSFTVGEACSTFDKCMNKHFQSNVLRSMLDDRCKFDNISTAKEDATRITFIHLPKTGGSSVRDFLKYYAKRKARASGHEHFVVAAFHEPNNLFSTMLREPVARAVSFYRYVNSVQFLSRAGEANPLWQATHRILPGPWSSDPFVQDTLHQDPLGFFLRNVSNISHSITHIDYKKIQALPEVPLKNTIPGSLKAFLNHTASLPEQYQCRQHLEVAFILLKHYEVVGTLEKSADFYKVLFRRAKLRDPHILEVHSNKSVYKLSDKDLALMEANLKEPLFCATVLWRIAGMISDMDAMCVR